jgi:hypothetical protein
MNRVWLVLIGFVALAFGAAYLVAPTLLTDQTGFRDLSAEALTDVRATYGGLQIALGVFLLWSSAQAMRHRTGLLLIAITFLALAACRGIGLLIDGDWTVAMVSAFFIEAATFVITIVLLSRGRSEPSAAL